MTLLGGSLKVPRQQCCAQKQGSVGKRRGKEREVCMESNRLRVYSAT